MAGRNRHRNLFAPLSLVKVGVKTGDMCIAPVAAYELRSFEAGSVELEE